jgi:hypothetical protein
MMGIRVVCVCKVTHTSAACVDDASPVTRKYISDVPVLIQLERKHVGSVIPKPFSAA